MSAEPDPITDASNSPEHDQPPVNGQAGLPPDDPNNGDPVPDESDPMTDNDRFTLLKIEYEKCTARYENIYKAIWTQFSYLATIAGVIFGFFKTQGLEYLPALGYAMCPLVLWLVITYIPLDCYGSLVLRRLKDIEDKLNDEHGSNDFPLLAMYNQFTEKKGFPWINRYFDPTFEFFGRIFRVRYVLCIYVPLVAFLVYWIVPSESGQPSVKLHTTIRSPDESVEISFSAKELDIEKVKNLRTQLREMVSDVEENVGAQDTGKATPQEKIEPEGSSLGTGHKVELQSDKDSE